MRIILGSVRLLRHMVSSVRSPYHPVLGTTVVDRCSMKALTVPRVQFLARHRYGELENPVCQIVGGVISPPLANIALHGMEEALGVTRRKAGPSSQTTSDSAVVRYADDFVVTCTTRDEAERAIDRLIPWLAERGLTLSEEKTRIVHITGGFDFLGFNVRQYDAPGHKKRGKVLLIKPSRTSVVRIRARLRDEWLSLRGHSVKEVPARLNPIIRGQANYYRPYVSSQTFKALDAWMFRREVRYVRHTHPTKPWYWQKAQYWGTLHRQRDDNWVFADKRTGIVLLKFSWFNIARHVLVKGTASPDDPTLADYWGNRQKHKASVLSPSRQKMARIQNYRCAHCGEHLLNDEELHVHHKMWRSKGGVDTYDNLMLTHLYCHQQIHAKGDSTP
jgi:RNA-directed DNA polymerase